MPILEFDLERFIGITILASSDTTWPSSAESFSWSVELIDIESLQNRSLKVCYVPAISPALIGFWLQPLTVLIKQTSQAIVPLLSDPWLDESEKQMKKTLKTLILETVPAKCDI